MQENKYTPTNGGDNKFIYRSDKKIKRPVKLDPRAWGWIMSFLNGLLAGIIFSIGSLAYLSVDSRYLGSALFAIGLMVVFSYGFGLYTSKIGYIIGQPLEKNLHLIPLWLGNFAGAALFGVIISLVRESYFNKLFDRANELCSVKLADTSGGILIMSLLCGILMFVATDSYKNAKNNAQRYITLFACVMVFLLCGLEHFTANVFYLVVADALDFKAFWYILVMTVGNSLGALLIPACHKGITALKDFTKAHKI